MTIPEQNNMHMLIKSPLSREKIASSYEAFGWKIHLLDDDEFRARFYNAFADLEFMRINHNEFLLNGAVADLQANIGKLILPLTQARISKSQISCDEIRI